MIVERGTLPISVLGQHEVLDAYQCARLSANGVILCYGESEKLKGSYFNLLEVHVKFGDAAEQGWSYGERDWEGTMRAFLLFHTKSSLAVNSSTFPVTNHKILSIRILGFSAGVVIFHLTINIINIQ